MYCKNCGKEMKERAAVCLECGVGKNGGSKYCGHCGSDMPENVRVCIIQLSYLAFYRSDYFVGNCYVGG